MNIDRKLVVQFACVAAVPILYAASSGPLLLLAAKWNDDQGVTFRRALHFYRPMFWIAHHTSFESALRSYLQLWGLRPFQVAGLTGSQPLTVWPPSLGVHRRYASPPPPTPIPGLAAKP